MCTCGAFCGRLWQSPVKEMIQVQGFGSEKVLQLLYGERMRCHLLDSKWRSGWGRPSPPPSPPSPWLYNNCICIMTIFFPTFFPKQCVMTMKFWQCLKFRDVFSQTVLITSLVSCVCLKMWHTPKSQLDLGKVNGKVTPPKKKKSTWVSLASDILQPRTGTARQDSAMVLLDHQEGKSSVFFGSGSGSKIQILGTVP